MRTGGSFFPTMALASTLLTRVLNPNRFSCAAVAVPIVLVLMAVPGVFVSMAVPGVFALTSGAECAGVCTVKDVSANYSIKVTLI